MYKLFDMKKILVALLLVFIIAFKAFAFQLTPNEVFYQATGSNSVQTYTITNNSNESIAIEIKALKRSYDSFGNEIENPKESRYFSIMPRKVIVRPNSNQVVRVQYRGPRQLKNEGAYRILFSQRSYQKGKNEEGKGIFTFLYAYSTVAYVEPVNIVNNVSVTSLAPIIDNKAEITITNSGTVHKHLNNLRIEFSENGEDYYKVDEKNSEAYSSLNLLANSQVKKYVNLPEELKGATKDLKVKYYFDK